MSHRWAAAVAKASAVAEAMADKMAGHADEAQMMNEERRNTGKKDS